MTEDPFKMFVSSKPSADILEQVSSFNQSKYPRVSKYNTVAKIFTRIKEIHLEQEKANLSALRKCRLENEYKTLRGKHYVLEGMRDDGPALYISSGCTVI